MKECLIEIGRIVLSKSGRDAGKYFIIYDIIDKDYVYIINGGLRKISKPKKKKIKHLELKPVKFDELANKFASNEMVLDSEVRSAIENYLNTQR